MKYSIKELTDMYKKGQERKEELARQGFIETPIIDYAYTLSPRKLSPEEDKQVKIMYSRFAELARSLDTVMVSPKAVIHQPTNDRMKVNLDEYEPETQRANRIPPNRNLGTNERETYFVIANFRSTPEKTVQSFPSFSQAKNEANEVKKNPDFRSVSISKEVSYETTTFDFN